MQFLRHTAILLSIALKVEPGYFSNHLMEEFLCTGRPRSSYTAAVSRRDGTHNRVGAHCQGLGFLETCADKRGFFFWCVCRSASLIAVLVLVSFDSPIFTPGDYWTFSNSLQHTIYEADTGSVGGISHRLPTTVLQPWWVKGIFLQDKWKQEGGGALLCSVVYNADLRDPRVNLN